MGLAYIHSEVALGTAGMADIVVGWYYWDRVLGSPFADLHPAPDEVSLGFLHGQTD